MGITSGRQPSGRQPDDRQPSGRQPGTPGGAALPAVSGYFSEGTQVDSSGVVQTSFVDHDFAGAVGDVYILGTRHRSDGFMYITTDSYNPSVSPPDVFINGIRHSATGIRYVDFVRTTENTVSKGFLAHDDIGTQSCTVVVDGEIDHGILRSDNQEMVVSSSIPTMWHDFVGDRSIIPKIGPYASLTFVRNTIGTHFDANGVMQTSVAGAGRFDHDPVSLVSLGFLLEESSENLCLGSRNIDEGNAAWLDLSGNVTSVTNHRTAPDGTTTVTKLGDDSGGGTGTVALYQVFTILSATDYMWSCVVEADGLDWAALGHGSFDTSGISYFDLSNGVVGTKDANHSASGIIPWGNGPSGVARYRIWIVFQSTTDLTGNCRIYVAEGDLDTTVDLDGTSSIAPWGAQLEVDKEGIPTSFIPTTTSTVPRDKDSPEISDVSWYDQSGGVLVVDWIPGISSVTQDILHLNNNTFQESHIVRQVGTKTYFNSRDGSVDQYSIATLGPALSAGVASISVVRFSLNDIAGCSDGSALVTDSVATMPTITKMEMGGAIPPFGGNPKSMHLRALRYYDNTDFTDAEVISMSNGIFPT